MLAAMGQAELAGCAIRASIGRPAARRRGAAFVDAWEKDTGAQANAARRASDMAALRDHARRRPQTVEHVESLEKYKHGFVTDIDQEFAPKGLNADIVRFISAKKDEPEWMLDWRLEAYRALAGAGGADLGQGPLPADRLPGQLLLRRAEGEGGPKSLDEVDPELLATYAKLGIPLREQEVLAGVRRARGRAAAMRSTRCSTASRWSPPSRRSWPRRA